MNLIGKCLFALAVLTLATLFPLSAESATISIDSVDAKPGESFAVGIWMTNNSDAISALTIPIRYNNQNLTLDSVSFDGTVLTNSFKGVAYVNATEQNVRISYIPDEFSNPLPTISASQGKIATIYFTLETGASPELIVIDSVFKDSVLYFNGTEIHYWTRVELSDQSGTTIIYPAFNAGAVNVQISTDINDPRDNILPTEYALGQNYPNPFNPSTIIDYSLPKAGYISLQVFNVVGQEVATLFEGFMGAGNHQVEFQAADMPSGIYFYRLSHKDGSNTKKMLLVK